MIIDRYNNRYKLKKYKTFSVLIYSYIPDSVHFICYPGWNARSGMKCRFEVMKTSIEIPLWNDTRNEIDGLHGRKKSCLQRHGWERSTNAKGKQMQVLLNKFQLSQSLYISRRHPLQRLPLQKFHMNSHVWFSVKSCDRMWSHVFTNENSHDFTCEDSHVPNSHVNFHIISHMKIKWFRMWKLTGFKITCEFYTCEFMWNSCKGI